MLVDIVTRRVDSLTMMKTASRQRGLMKTPSRRRGLEDAIDATACSLTRLDGPDVFQRLKFEKETTHFIRRWRRFMKMA